MRPAGGIAVFLASMGPRLNSRGDTWVWFCGSAFPAELQWGRDLIVAETILQNCTAQNHPPASMGPRLNSRGDDLLPELCSATVPASMGPRLNSRGDRPVSVPASGA